MRAWEAAGLFVAWAIHDAEEWVTAGSWSRSGAERRDVPRWLRRLPWASGGISDRQMRTAILAMAAVIAGAAADGVRTEGRSAFFRASVVGFGLHGIGHLAASAALRSYTPGVVTAPITVLPYAAWALRRMQVEHSALRARDLTLAALLVPASLGASHAFGAAVEGRLARVAPRTH